MDWVLTRIPRSRDVNIADLDSNSLSGDEESSQDYQPAEYLLLHQE